MILALDKGYELSYEMKEDQIKALRDMSSVGYQYIVIELLSGNIWPSKTGKERATKWKGWGLPLKNDLGLQ